MNRIYWLASYPKSGNTWVRAFLTAYRDETRQGVDINALTVSGAAARRWFDNSIGVEASMLPDHLIQRLRPQVYRRLAQEIDQPLFLKIHDAWGLTDQGEPLIPVEVTAGVIYIVRNPLDVAPSFAHHHGLTIEEAVDRICGGSVAPGVLVDKLSEQLPQHFSSWSSHSRSWIEESKLSVHVVRYEDLRTCPEDTFARLVRFAGLTENPDHLRWAIAQADFDRLRQQEQASGFRERQPQASAPFFRRGQIGSWRSELPPALATRLIEANRGMMQHFGYLDEQDVVL